jgi:hypothetical protein
MAGVKLYRIGVLPEATPLNWIAIAQFGLFFVHSVLERG